MHYRELWFSSIVLVAIGFGALASGLAQSPSLPSRESSEGQVMVTVTPTLSNSENWRFAVQLNTHVSPLTQDLATVSMLSDGKGHDEKPVAWQGDPPGGHHRKGVLLFKPFSPRPESVTLKIQRVGSVPERTFTWKLAEQ